MSDSVREDYYWWRLLATGLGFVVFGLGALVLSVLVFPVVSLSTRNASVRKARVRWWVSVTFGRFLRLMQALGLMRLEIIHGERLQQVGSYLVVANHPSLLDVVALISLIPDAGCVVKKALWDNPFMGGVVRAADYISNADTAQLIDDCVQQLQQPHPVVLFPEGTRSKPGQALHFQRGAAYVAIKHNKPLIPVLITCQPSTLTKGQKWYKIPPKRFHLRLEVLDPWDLRGHFSPDEAPTLQARHLTQAMEKMFTEKLHHVCNL
ncbi:1-acyl-sn-glycerol-3-phosphate acyltransferase [Curvibacter sp. CHRR-16]|uniref:lysophospholipid acyltransferase family protein n=1 Tax=Curvibacter sp. CHRR-16 TaxID=2835872 RepID=UPI0032EA78B3